jgi:hypothetical protein
MLLVVAVFVIIISSVYGALWPTSFSSMLSVADIQATMNLGYSFYLAMSSAPLLTASGVLAYQVRHAFADVYDDDDSDDDVTDEITNENGLSSFMCAPSQDDGIFDVVDVTRRPMCYLDRSSLWHDDSFV